MAKVAFLGLGVMGFPMAGHLVKKGGHELTVYNRTAAKAKQWTDKHGGRSAPTPKAAAEGQDFVMCCVGNDNDLRAVTLGADGAFAGMKKGATFVDHTTASAEIARELDAAATKAGFKFVDAPVSGGQAGAENGVLTVMCGGSPDAYTGAEPVIAAYARMCKLLGPAGSGQLTKMVNQICIAGLVEGRDHQDGHVPGGRVGPQALAHLKPADLGHHDVQEDHVGAPGGDLAEGVFAVGGGAVRTLPVGLASAPSTSSQPVP